MNNIKMKNFSFLLLNAFFTALLCTVISTRYFLVPVVGDIGFKAILFACLYAFGQYFLIVFLVILIVSIIPWLLKWVKTTYFLVILIDSLALIYVLTDTFVWAQFRTHLNVAMLQMTFLGKGQIVVFSDSDILEIILLACLCFIGGAGIAFLSRLIRFTPKVNIVLVSSFLGITLATNLSYGWAFAKQNMDILMATDVVPGAFRLTYNHFLVRHGIFSKEEIGEFNKTIPNSATMSYPIHPLVCKAGKVPDYNLVILAIDSLRADSLSPELMPETWASSRLGIRFDDHWSGGNATRTGLFTLFTGIPGSYWKPSLYSKTPSILIQALQQRGYEIGAFTGAPLDQPEFEQTIFSGVKNLRIESPGETILERDKNAEEDFEKWVDQLPPGKKFFGFVFLDNVHGTEFPEDPENTFFEPFVEKLSYLKLTNDTDPLPVFNRYRNSVRYADKAIGRLFDFLEGNHLLSNTVVIFTSDHGSEFNENGQNYWSHNGNFTKYQVKVPLVIWWPGKKPEVIEYRTSGLDIVPTLLPDLLGCENPISDYSSGHSLWTKAERPFVYSSSYSKEAYIEPERTVLIDEKGVMNFVDNNNLKAKDTSLPGYLRDVMKEKTRFLKE